jgi:hypothetical protein
MAKTETPFKRFMVFELVRYYPSGGIGDCIESYDTLEEAKQRLDKEKLDNRLRSMYEIFDRIEGVMVLSDFD